MLRRLWPVAGDEVAQDTLRQGGATTLHKSVEAGTRAPVRIGHDSDIADMRMRLEALGDTRCIVHQARASALAIGEAQDVARDEVVNALAGCHPDPGEDALACQYPTLGGRNRLRRITELVFQKMSQVLVGGEPKQQVAPLETDGELEIRDICASVAAAQPVLLLGKVVVADAGAVQLAQDGFGGAEIGDLAVWPGNVQCDTIDPAARERAGPRKAQRRRNPQGGGRGK